MMLMSLFTHSTHLVEIVLGVAICTLPLSDPIESDT